MDSRQKGEDEPALAEALLDWRKSTPYTEDSGWVFASPTFVVHARLDLSPF
jgi:hypothetical protein